MNNVITGSGVVIERDGRVALRTSDFTVPEAAITAVIGPNGSGKSTLLHAMTGLLPLSEGSLEVKGLEPEQARNDIAYVLQHMNVSPGTPMTVQEVVSMGRYSTLGVFRRARSADKEAVRDAMGLLRIDDLADRQVFRLSGGQRQRVFVAQALAQELPSGLCAVSLNPGIINTEMLQTCFGKESAAPYPTAPEWAQSAGPYLLKLGPKDNGQALTVPGMPAD